MELRIIIVLLLLTCSARSEPTAYMDMVLRARTAAEARDRLGVTTGGSGTQTNISYVAVTNAPWQWGSPTLTNWANVPVLWQTNTVWEQLAGYSNTYAYPTTGVFTNEVQVISLTTTGGIYRVENTFTLYLDFETNIYYGLLYQAYVVWEYVGNNTTNNVQTNYIANGNFVDSQPHSPDPMDSYVQSMSDQNQTPLAVWLNPKPGTTISIYTRNSADASGYTPVYATNYMDISVSKANRIRFLTQ